ncbi:hypothetical protein CEXT_43331 [Caerostris extrusa]|uniref:F-box/LRR-repeat protein n=1 Tax=Caerostris extrusa TaxID=172846 RepID=A0AAV4TNR6_CAEEX|nr:hypothetical protein CEXT_43331 [Caerostris extrusa]
MLFVWTTLCCSKVLRMKSLSKIDTLGVRDCRLSRAGLKELVQKCVNLKKVAFESLDADLKTVAKELKRDIRTTYSHVVSHYFKFQKIYDVHFM